MSEKLRNSVVVVCDETSCTFANGDELTYANDFLNLSGDTGYGFVMSIDWYDAKSGETFCGYEIYQSYADGKIFPLTWYEMNDEQSYNVTDYEYDNMHVLAQLPMHPTNAQFWHCIYDAIQRYDNLA